MTGTSILTCTHGMRKYLPWAIGSVLAQRCSDWEYLVLDDGSTDGTWDWLRSLSHPKIKIFKNSVCQGLTWSRNFLLSKAKGAFVSILDADDFLFPWKIGIHQKILNRDSSIGVVWGRSVVLTEQGKRWRVSRFMPPFGFEPGWDIATPYQAAHSSTTWRKSSILAAGGYDPKWTLMVAPALFLRVGDYAAQYFSEVPVVAKRHFPRNAFRVQLTRQVKAAMSRELLQETLARRFGLELKGRVPITKIE